MLQKEGRIHPVVELLDSSRKAFVNETCFHDEVTCKYILKKLVRMGFSKNNVVRRSDLYLAREGDYEIRSVGEDLLISTVEFNGDNFNLRQIGQL